MKRIIRVSGKTAGAPILPGKILNQRLGEYYSKYIDAYNAAAIGDTLMFGAGTFDLNTAVYTFAGYSATALYSIKNLKLEGIPGETILNVRSDIVSASVRDNSCLSSRTTTYTAGTFGNIKNCIVRYFMASKGTANYSNAVFHTCQACVLNNCVLEISGGLALTMNIFDTAFSTPHNILNNCTIIAPRDFDASYSYGKGQIVDLNNCALNVTLPDCQKANCIFSQTFDESYINSDPAANLTQGVYSGPNAWPLP